ncbi:MAG: hypothetical protein ABEK16_04040 [Candidatus Nanohalobium sp.]
MTSVTIFMVTSDDPFNLPGMNQGVKLPRLSTVLGVTYSLLVKVSVADILVIALSSTIDFFAAGS